MSAIPGAVGGGGEDGGGDGVKEQEGTIEYDPKEQLAQYDAMFAPDGKLPSGKSPAPSGPVICSDVTHTLPVLCFML